MTFPDIIAAGCLGIAIVLAAILFIDWAAQGVIDAISDMTQFEDKVRRVPYSADAGPSTRDALLIACAVVAVGAYVLWLRWPL